MREHIGALRAQALAQRANDNIRRREDALMLLHARTRLAIPARGMGFVEHPAKAEALTQGCQATEIWAIAIHGVDALSDDEDDAVEGGLLVEHELERIEVIVREATETRARGHNTFKHARMHQAVCEDDVTRLGQATKDGRIRRKARIQDQAMRIALPRS